MRWVDQGNLYLPASVNMAIQEYLLGKGSAEDYVFFYVNEPSVIIGRYQNAWEEVDEAYCRKEGIQVVRRLSGGGAVYTDRGNLNYSFITRDEGESFMNFRRFIQPVAEALRALGVPAEVTGRNDIQVGERKISGNAQYASGGRLMTHGTLTLSLDLERMQRALTPKAEKFQSKSTKSVRARVANIQEFLKEPMDVEALRAHLLRHIFRGSSAEPYRLTEEDWAKIRKLVKERYENWEWNFGRSPAFNVQVSRRVEGVGTVDVRLWVKDGIIESCTIYGDFFGHRPLEELEKLLIGKPYRKEDLAKVLAGVEVSRYIGGLSREDFLELL